MTDSPQKMLRHSFRSEFRPSDNVLKTEWTYYKRYCRTKIVQATYYASPKCVNWQYMCTQTRVAYYFKRQLESTTLRHKYIVLSSKYICTNMQSVASSPIGSGQVVVTFSLESSIIR